MPAHRLVALVTAALSLGVACAHADELKEAQAAYRKADLALNQLWAKLKAEFIPERFAAGQGADVE